MDSNNIFVILGCILGIIVLGLIFKTGLKKILKLIINSILGGTLIYLINLIGTTFNFHIGLNVVTAIFVGIFGIPGAIFLILLKIF